MFAEDVLKFYDAKIKPRWPDARVIIRCDNRTSIEHMAGALQDGGRSYVAIHERFKDEGGKDWERKSVPRRNDKDSDRWYGPNGPIFWIHQFKLLEGIDDDRFRLVAIFEPLGNDRQVVQQIGRVIRNPEQPAEGQAFVLDHSRGRHARSWQALFRHDDDLAKENASTSLLQEDFVNEILRIHPERAYLDGTARHRFSFSTFDPCVDLRLPLAANLLQKSPHFDLNKLTLSIERRLQEADRVWKRLPDTNGRTVIFVYVAVNNAPFLESSYFLSGTPGVIVIHELEKLVAFYDSAGTSPLGLVGLSKAARPEHLRRLFSRREGSKLVEIATKNAHLGYRAARTRALSAASVDETVPALDDHVQVLTRVTGYSVEPSRDWEGGKRPIQIRRRYLGFRRGRVVELGERLSLDEYRAWLEELEQAVTGDRRQLTTFSRYAKMV